MCGKSLTRFWHHFHCLPFILYVIRAELSRTTLKANSLPWRMSSMEAPGPTGSTKSSRFCSHKWWSLLWTWTSDCLPCWMLLSQVVSLRLICSIMGYGSFFSVQFFSERLFNYPGFPGLFIKFKDVSGLPRIITFSQGFQDFQELQEPYSMLYAPTGRYRLQENQFLPTLALNHYWR